MAESFSTVTRYITDVKQDVLCVHDHEAATEPVDRAHVRWAKSSGLAPPFWLARLVRDAGHEPGGGWIEKHLRLKVNAAESGTEKAARKSRSAKKPLRRKSR